MTKDTVFHLTNSGYNVGSCMLQVGQLYTRGEVHAEVRGGNPMQYLLTHDKRVLAACLDPKLNPKAPRVILDFVDFGDSLLGFRTRISVTGFR